MAENILVLGGNGFIGRHLTAALISMGTDDGNVPCIYTPRHTDLCTPKAVEDLFTSRLEWSRIFFLAGNPRVSTATFSDGVWLLEQVLKHCRGGIPFIFASSATVYGDVRNPPANEKTELRPTSEYAASKIAGEALVQAHTLRGNIFGVSLRLVANVGRGSTHGLLHDIVRKLRSDAPTLQLLGEAPGSKKPFCFVGDTVEAMILASEHHDWLEPVVNISPADAITVEDVANITMDNMGIQKEIEWLGWGKNWAGDNTHVSIDSSLALELGWSCRGSADAVKMALLTSGMAK